MSKQQRYHSVPEFPTLMHDPTVGKCIGSGTARVAGYVGWDVGDAFAVVHAAAAVLLDKKFFAARTDLELKGPRASFLLREHPIG